MLSFHINKNLAHTDATGIFEPKYSYSNPNDGDSQIYLGFMSYKYQELYALASTMY